MNASHLTAPLRTTRPALRAGMVALTLMLLNLCAAAPAGAYTQLTSGRAAGAMVGHQIQGSHYNTCPGMPYSCFNTWITATGPTVYRSRASHGYQTVGVAYYLSRWNGTAWVRQASRSHVRSIAPGQQAIVMPRVDFLPSSLSGAYMMTIAAAWADASGRSLGARGLSFNQPGDYVCATRVGTCDARQGFVYVR